MTQIHDVHGQKLPGNLPFGHTFSSYILNAPAYIEHLGAEVRSRGAPIYRQRLSSLDQAYDLPSVGPVSLVVNASGLGSKTLIGVEDDTMYPALGQTVLVKAPLVKTCIMHVEGFMASGTAGASEWNHNEADDRAPSSARVHHPSTRSRRPRRARWLLSKRQLLHSPESFRGRTYSASLLRP